MRIRLKLFAILREKASIAETELELPDGITIASALEHIARKFPAIAGYLNRAAVAVNLNYAKREDLLQNGDELALIPPVSGGCL